MSRNEVDREKAHLEITWNDQESSATGYVVIDRLSRGVASGGLRMRPGCTIAEVRGLARAMTKKEAVHFKAGMRYVPMGGAKGGIDFDPLDPAAAAVLERFLVDLRAIIGEHWAMGEDYGVRQDAIDEIFARRALGSPVAAVLPLIADPEASRARQARGFTELSNGVSQDELVGGLGVAQTAITALEHYGIPIADARVVVQGFGSMGGASALFLARAGARVVGIADADGFVTHADGLNVETLFAHRDRFGRINRDRLPAGTVVRDRDTWIGAECEVLIPAALSQVITEENEHLVTARLIVEAANLPVTGEAEHRLRARGIAVIPDFVANSGTNAWWWWLVFGDVDGSWEASERLVRERLAELTTEVLEGASLRSESPREAALALVDARLRLIEQQPESADVWL